MNKFLNLSITFIVFFILIGCSFGNRTGVWKDASEELEGIKKEKLYPIKPIFTKVEQFKKEVLSDKEINISTSIKNQNWLQQGLTSGNYVPHIKYDNIKEISYRSKKIGKNPFRITDTDFEPLIFNGSIFFYDPTGNIFNYSINDEEIIWKFNFYKRKFEEIPILIDLKIDSNNLIVSDNLGYLYSLNIDNAEVNWAKNYGIPFRSNIKIDEDNIFLINQDNKFYAIKKNDGVKYFDFETFPSFLKSQKEKSNISVDQKNDNVYFITSTGEVYSINYKSGNINWLYKTSRSTLDKKGDIFFSSPIIFRNNKILISTSVSTILLNAIDGSVIWNLAFSTFVRPVISNNYIFLLSTDGFILNISMETGKIVWSTNLLENVEKISKRKVAEIGEFNSLILLSDQIFLSSKNGYFLFADYQNGKATSYLKLSRGFFSKPVVANGKAFVIDKDMRILVFN